MVPGQTESQQPNKKFKCLPILNEVYLLRQKLQVSCRYTTVWYGMYAYISYAFVHVFIPVARLNLLSNINFLCFQLRRMNTFGKPLYKKNNCDSYWYIFYVIIESTAYLITSWKNRFHPENSSGY